MVIVRAFKRSECEAGNSKAEKFVGHLLPQANIPCFMAALQAAYESYVKTTRFPVREGWAFTPAQAASLETDGTPVHVMLSDIAAGDTSKFPFAAFSKAKQWEGIQWTLTPQQRASNLSLSTSLQLALQLPH